MERLYKILIVEDDETIAGGLKNHLEKWNYQAECMTDFKDVMGKFVEFEPQLVLLDIVLPFFNGFHWCQEIRKISKVPIIFLSSANDNMNIVMAMNMGGDEFIEKPFDRQCIVNNKFIAVPESRHNTFTAYDLPCIFQKYLQNLEFVLAQFQFLVLIQNCRICQIQDRTVPLHDICRSTKFIGSS